MSQLFNRVALGAALGFFVSSYAQAGATGGYISLGGGASFLDEESYDVMVEDDGSGGGGMGAGGAPATGTPLDDILGALGGAGGLGGMGMGGGNPNRDFEADYDDGFLGNLAVGVILENGFRAELELRYAENDFESISGQGGSAEADGTINSKALMGNVFYDFNREGWLHPYLGAGIGSAEIEVEDQTFPDGGDNVLNGKDTVLAFQGGAGISLDITDRLAADLGYRYFEAVNPQISDDQVDAEFGYAQHAALLSLRYVFNVTGGIDSDNDGVDDQNDDCPDTPQGVSVDGSGCPVDNDGDGVPDFKDDCPNTPRGVSVDDKGCPLDSDGDGVTDDKDDCPNTPSGTEVNARGCPLDSDGDGVPNAKDDCPGTPAGAEVTANGCAVAQTFTLEGIRYEYESAKLTAEAKAKLDETATTLKNSPGFRIELSGHTDAKGTESYNQKLSQQRADAARRYLIDQGVQADRIEAVGYGESQPVAPNTNDDGSDNPEGRAKNRRTEIKVLDE